MVITLCTIRISNLNLRIYINIIIFAVNIDEESLFTFTVEKILNVKHSNIRKVGSCDINNTESIVIDYNESVIHITEVVICFSSCILGKCIGETAVNSHFTVKVNVLCAFIFNEDVCLVVLCKATAVRGSNFATETIICFFNCIIGAENNSRVCGTASVYACIKAFSICDIAFEKVVCTEVLVSTDFACCNVTIDMSFILNGTICEDMEVVCDTKFSVRVVEAGINVSFTDNFSVGICKIFAYLRNDILAWNIIAHIIAGFFVLRYFILVFVLGKNRRTGNVSSERFSFLCAYSRRLCSKHTYSESKGSNGFD